MKLKRAAKTLGGTINPALMPPPETIGAGLYGSHHNLTVDDVDVSHPFAETARIRVSYQAAGFLSRAPQKQPGRYCTGRRRLA